jgi:hypothetical protein
MDYDVIMNIVLHDGILQEVIAQAMHLDTETN